jgi:hypothetical protein
MDTSAARHRIAEFCAALPQLRTAAAQQGWAEQLHGTVEAVQADPAGAPQALSQLWRFLGLDVAGRGADIDAGLTGHAPTPPPGGAYACPRQACARLHPRAPGEPTPACEVFRVSMVWQR